MDINSQKAEAGDVETQVNLGFAYHYGEGIFKDDVEAVKWHLQTADPFLPREQMLLTFNQRLKIKRDLVIEKYHRNSTDYDEVQ